MIDWMFLVAMFWPNDSILNRVCCVLLALEYLEKGIQNFQM